MNLLTQLDDALSDLMRGQQSNPPINVWDLLDHAIDDVMALFKPTAHYSSMLAEALMSMRAAMTTADPFVGDRPDGHEPAPFDEHLAGRCPHTDTTGEIAIRTNAARTQHRDLLTAAQVLAQAAARIHTNPTLADARTAAAKAAYLHTLTLRWLPRPATSKERAETERANDPTAKGCVSCARTFVRPGVKRWEPVYRGELCDWCYRGPVGKLRTGDLPPLPLLEARHNGKKIRVPA